MYMYFKVICLLSDSYVYVYLLEALKDYFVVVLAGLAGSPHMVSATLLSLSRLVYEFHGRLCMCVEICFCVTLKQYTFYHSRPPGY